MPYWATLEEAIVLLNFSYETTHKNVLVFDEAYRLMGILDQKEILRDIQPKFSKNCSDRIVDNWGKLMSSFNLKQLKKPIKDFMTPFNIIVDIKDHVLKAANLMLEHNIDMLPVKDSERVVGTLKMHDVFHEITAFIIKS
jgi:hypothetical protein